MSLQAVVGINWGDEGKGRMIDYLAQKADYVVRFQGGNNAGHTVINEHGEFKLHLIPSGIFNPDTINVLGPGMVINVDALLQEIAEVEERGISARNICISNRATVCFDFHRLEDGWEEERLGKAAYGSTKQGIAPAYADRYAKKSIQIGELLDKGSLKDRLKGIVEWKNRIAGGVYHKNEPIRLEEVFEKASLLGEKIKPYVCDTSELLEQAADEGKTVLFEAQLGALRDIYYGIYPFTTSSSTLAANAALGGGLFNHQLDTTIGVMKAFSTCVGTGPFVTEMPEDEAGPMREVAKEFGATTGRPRRIGHFDAVASRYGVRVQGATQVALTKLDVLSGLPTLKVCTGYKVNGKVTQSFPLNYELEKAEPVYEELSGWEEDITACRRFENLPQNAQNYVLRLEELVKCPITFVSVGPERESLIER